MRGLLRSSYCELLLLETGMLGQREFWNPRETERPPLESATKQRLVKNVTDWEDLVCPVIIFKCSNELYKYAIDPTTSPNPVYSHTMSRDSILN
jgi:hypothetical protein